MTRSSNQNPIQPLPEPERTLRLLSKCLQEGLTVARAEEGSEEVPEIKDKMEANNNNNNNNGNEDNGMMYDYTRPSLKGTRTCIARPSIVAKNFEIKPNII